MRLNGVQRVVLRAFLRHIRSLEKCNTSLWLQTFPHVSEFQTTLISTSKEDLATFVSTFPSPIQEYLALNIPSRVISSGDLRRIVSTAYRSKDPFKYCHDSVGESLECLKILNDQMRLNESTSIKTTNNVRVVASAVYDRRETGKLRDIHGEGSHSFYYRVTVENCGDDVVQLIGRHWLFKSDDSKIEVPKFSGGVIGVKPLIKPGQKFQYMSMTHLNSDRGTMEGSFLMQGQSSGDPFEVEVGQCALNPHVFVS